MIIHNCVIENQVVLQEIEILIQTMKLSWENIFLASSFSFPRRVIPLQQKLALGLTWQ